MKRFIIRKSIMASSIKDALSKEKNSEPEDIWIDEEWKKLQDEIDKDKGFGFDDRKRVNK